MSLDLSSYTDEKLMELYQEEDVLAFEELYRRHAKLAYGYLVKKTMNESTAQDILQTVFLKLHQYRGRYNKDLPFLPWFFVIMKNALVDSYKLQKELPFQNIENQALKNDPSYEMTDSDFQDIIKDLPKKSQEALQLRYAQDLDFNQIAKNLHTSEVNVRKIISRAIGELKVVFKGKRKE